MSVRPGWTARRARGSKGRLWRGGGGRESGAVDRLGAAHALVDIGLRQEEKCYHTLRPPPAGRPLLLFSCVDSRSRVDPSHCSITIHVRPRASARRPNVHTEASKNQGDSWPGRQENGGRVKAASGVPSRRRRLAAGEHQALSPRPQPQVQKRADGERPGASCSRRLRFLRADWLDPFNGPRSNAPGSGHVSPLVQGGSAGVRGFGGWACQPSLDRT